MLAVKHAVALCRGFAGCASGVHTDTQPGRRELCSFIPSHRSRMRWFWLGAERSEFMEGSLSTGKPHPQKAVHEPFFESYPARGSVPTHASPLLPAQHALAYIQRQPFAAVAPGSGKARMLVIGLLSLEGSFDRQRNDDGFVSRTNRQQLPNNRERL